VIEAATVLFLRDGYSRTSLAAVAERARVGERTVYARFETKARLFQRVIEAATVGDSDSAPLPERDWSRRAMSAPTLAERIEAFADGVADMHERLGPLMAVNGEVEASEPEVQLSASAAREATVAFLGAFWGNAQRDGLLPEGTDVAWLVSTSVILSAAETRLIISRHHAWERAEYRRWLADTWSRLIAGAGAAPPCD
jgi:AcrR family transcriptional regulator